MWGERKVSKPGVRKRGSDGTTSSIAFGLRAASEQRRKIHSVQRDNAERPDPVTQPEGREGRQRDENTSENKGTGGRERVNAMEGRGKA